MGLGPRGQKKLPEGSWGSGGWAAGSGKYPQPTLDQCLWMDQFPFLGPFVGQTGFGIEPILVGVGEYSPLPILVLGLGGSLGVRFGFCPVAFREWTIWVWVKVESPGYGPQVLVLVSIY